jgi:NAD kinase
MYRERQPRIVVVTRETRMAGVLKRWATKGQAKFVFRRARAAAAVQAGDMARAVAAQTEDQDEDFDDLLAEDDTYHDSVSRLTRDLDLGIPVQTLDRAYLPNYDFDMCAVVVVVGQDGLVANTAKYVGDVPIVGVNPDPDRFDGVLLPFRPEDARGAVSRVLKQQAVFRDVTLAEATLHDGQRLLAFNDLFIGARSHVSARYELSVGEKSEQQSSSGILVSTGAGSTGWMSSVFNMTRGVAYFLGAPIPEKKRPHVDWSDRALLWVVREPFLSRTSGVTLVAGRLAEGDLLTLESAMPYGGVIFSDGIEADFLEFNSGAIARIGVAAQRARLVVPTGRRAPHRR